MLGSRLVCVVVLLASCVTPGSPESPGSPPVESGWRPPTEGVDYGPFPENYEEIGHTALLAVLKDPESARWGRTSVPRREHAIVNQFRHEAAYGYSFCVEVNAKNGFGGYTGMQTYWILVRNGELVRMLPAPGQIYIGRAIDCRDGELPMPEATPATATASGH